MASVLVRCKKCRRPFAKSADYCPDCGRRSARGMRAYVAKVGSIVLAVIALAVAVGLSVGQYRLHEVKAKPSAAEPLPQADNHTDGEISFGQR